MASHAGAVDGALGHLGRVGSVGGSVGGLVCGGDCVGDKLVDEDPRSLKLLLFPHSLTPIGSCTVGS